MVAAVPKPWQVVAMAMLAPVMLPVTVMVAIAVDMAMVVLAMVVPLLAMVVPVLPMVVPLLATAVVVLAMVVPLLPMVGQDEADLVRTTIKTTVVLVVTLEAIMEPELVLVLDMLEVKDL